MLLTIYQPTDFFRLCRVCLLLLCLQLSFPTHAANAGVELNESEFLADIPMVYSGSRMPQLAADSAGAITVLDRAFIQESGARDIADLFRLVPGFQVGTSAGGRSVVAYHGLSGQISQRMQVYVDGRSLYAPYLFGGVDWSSVRVPLEEIERIEIQRGSNSVTYGANAFLGVIHIITRAAVQSAGFGVQVAQGNEGIRDSSFRWGHGTPTVQWRLSAGSKSDNGVSSRPNQYQINYLDFRSEFQMAAGKELTVLAGLAKSQFGIGYPDRAADPVRAEMVSSSFLHAQYRAIVNPDQEWSLSFSHAQDEGSDSFSIPPSVVDDAEIRFDSARKGTRNTMEYQHYAEWTPGLRASWGFNYSNVSISSRQLFTTESAQINDSWRVHLNQEWKPSPFWTVNLGGLWEQDKLTAMQFAPRLSLNWKPAPSSTLKFGYSSAFRTPSIFEQRANWRIESEGRTLDIRYLSTGGLESEKVRALDLVYQGELRSAGLSLDVRIFNEEVSNLITGELYVLPAKEAYTPNAVAYDLRNNAAANIAGFEYQITWRPKGATTLVWSQYQAQPEATKKYVLSSIPSRSSSLFASHSFGTGWATGLTYSEVTPIEWLGESTSAGYQRQVSLRLARSMKIGGAAVQMSANWRQPIGGYDEFRELQKNPKQVWFTVAVSY